MRTAITFDQFKKGKRTGGNNMTQAERVKQYLSDKGSITTGEGQILLGIRRTDNIVNQLIKNEDKECWLKRTNQHIEKVTQHGENEYGKFSYLRYFLVPNGYHMGANGNFEEDVA